MRGPQEGGQALETFAVLVVGGEAATLAVDGEGDLPVRARTRRRTSSLFTCALSLPTTSPCSTTGTSKSWLKATRLAVAVRCSVPCWTLSTVLWRRWACAATCSVTRLRISASRRAASGTPGIPETPGTATGGTVTAGISSKARPMAAAARGSSPGFAASSR